VARDSYRVDAVRTQCILRVCTCVGLSTRDDDTCAGAAEPLRDSSPDAARPTGDDGHPSVKTEESVDVDTLGIIHEIVNANRCREGVILAPTSSRRCAL
jgi:hypothetical protein